MIILKQVIVPAEKGCAPEGCLVVVDGLIYLALGAIYITEEAITTANRKLFVFLREEIDGA